jgi:uroporphyrin-III C-methyltransferase
VSRALVLAAHGSRRDKAVNTLVRQIAESIRSLRIFDEVAAAFHQGEPGFDEVLDELKAEEVTVVPLFTSAGHFTQVVLPEALSRNRRHAEVRLRQTPAVGTHSGMGALVARRVADIMRDHGFDRGSVSLAVVGHGTRRHPDSRESTLHLADALRRRRVAGEVLTAFIDDDPPLETLLTTARLPHLLVVPFLIGGVHAAADIPRTLDVARLATGDRRPFIVDQPIGASPGIIDLIIDLARRHTPPPPPRYRPRLVTAIKPEPGAVSLVGAGPGDPKLITLRGLELLREASVVVHDRLIGWDLLAEARPDAVLIDVGKGPGHAPFSQQEINQILVSHAQLGKSVVRLKGGDPFVFGRGSEEMEACEEAGVPVRVIPGVSSALAGPAAAGIPLTARGIARSFTVMTGHTAEDAPESSPAFSDTLVILMGRANLLQLTTELIAEGRDPATPAACIQSATTADQRVTRATLGTIANAADRDGLVSPVVTVIGAVAGLGSEKAESSTLLMEVLQTRAGPQVLASHQ